MFLVPLPQGPGCFFYVLFPTIYGHTLVAVDNTTLLFLGVLVLGFNKYLLEGPVAFKIYLNSKLAACALDAFPQALNIWDSHVSFSGSSPGGTGCLAVVPGSIGVLCCITNMVVTMFLPVAIYIFILNFVNGPPGILTPSQCFLECCSSSFRSSGMVQTDLALMVSVPMTLYLAARL